MAWTEDRVARLAKLWAEGLSASQIANDLGGVTRNAVIGKVHRLGLSGRDKPAGKGGKRKATTATAGTASTAPKKPGATANKNGNASKTNTTRPASPKPATAQSQPKTGGVDVDERIEIENTVEVEAVNENAEPKSRKLTLMQLTETTCKWPNGDPTMPGFSFCGHQSADEKPYCAFHNKVAFQPPSDRRRRR